MGRRTWESFPEKFRPLPGRTNIVLTSDAPAHDRLRAAGAQPASSLEQALELAERAAGSEEIWIIGGGKVYAETLHLIDTAIITVLDLNLDGDTRAPELGAQFTRSLSDPAELAHLQDQHRVPFRILATNEGLDQVKESLAALKKSPEGLFIIGYMLFPLLALVVAVLGFFLVLGGHRIFGVILLLVPTQLFIFGAYWAITNRKRLMAE